MKDYCAFRDAIETIHNAIQASSCASNKEKPTPIYGIPTGGYATALSLSSRYPGKYLVLLDAPSREFAALDGNSIAIVDDIIDSGATLQPYLDEFRHCFALFAKANTPARLYSVYKNEREHNGMYVTVAEVRDEWVHFPWEHAATPESNVVRLLQYIGEDPLRDGLKNTPARVCRALLEMTRGTKQNPKEILGTLFKCESDNIVISRGIRFSSMCEHHLLPFTGVAHVGYLPNGTVVGLSKLARLVDCFANRLQLQEQMTAQIADAIMQYVPDVRGAAVIVKAHHSCMGCRGVLKHDADMVTSSMLGVFRMSLETRAEFISLCNV